MRAPRYHFPEEVRSTTRVVASRMVREGTIARTPEELDAWIEGSPEVKASLARGGYGSHFASHDLLPLLDVFVVQAGGPPPAVATEPGAPKRSRGVALLALLAVAAVLVALALALLA